MDLHDYLNVRRVMKLLAREWGMPVFMAKAVIQRSIDDTWAKAQDDPEAAARLDKYFPDGKPTPVGYILRLGHAHEAGETIPYLFE